MHELAARLYFLYAPQNLYFLDTVFNLSSQDIDKTRQTSGQKFELKSYLDFIALVAITKCFAAEPETETDEFSAVVCISQMRFGLRELAELTQCDRFCRGIHVPFSGEKFVAEDTSEF